MKSVCQRKTKKTKDGIAAVIALTLIGLAMAVSIYSVYMVNKTGSFDLRSKASSDNLLLNPGFESGLSFWKFGSINRAAVTDFKYEGSYGLSVNQPCPSCPYDYGTQNAPVYSFMQPVDGVFTQGDFYKFSIRAKHLWGGDYRLRMVVWEVGGAYPAESHSSGSNGGNTVNYDDGWINLIYFASISKPGRTRLKAEIYLDTPTSHIAFDDVSLERMAATPIPPEDPTSTPAPPNPTREPTPGGTCPSPSLMSPTIVCKNNGTADITWSWSPISYATYYRLEMDTCADWTSCAPPYVVTGISTSHVINVTSPSVVRYGRVRVDSSNGNCDAPSEWSSVRSISIYCPGAPTSTPPPPNPTSTPPPPAPGSKND